MNIKKKYKFYYFYKIINLINKKFYYGIHSTNNLNDNYLGSGKIIKRAVKKYGKINFKCEKLKFFNSIQEALNYESEVVNKLLVMDKQCYNLKQGGIGGFYNINYGPDKQIYIEKRKESLKNHYENHPETKEKIGISVSNYVKNNPEKIKEKNKRASKTRENKREEINKSISIGLNNYYLTNDGNLGKKQRSKKSKEYWKSDKGLQQKEKLSKNNKGFNNPEFVVLLDEKYKMYYKKLIQYVVYSNLPDKFIKKIININIKHAIDYYEYLNLVQKVRKQSIKTPDIFTSSLIKTYCEPIKDLSYEYIQYKFIRENYLKFFNENIDKMLNINYSDSYFSDLYLNCLKYLNYLNIIYIDKIDKINIRSVFPNAQRATGLKTFILVNNNFNQNFKLIDGELNEYSIKIINNGSSFQLIWY